MLLPSPPSIDAIDYTAWPTATQVYGQLVGGNYWPEDETQQEQNFVAATAAINSAVSEFERRTGWDPFLATSSTTEVRTFDAPYHDGYLDLEGGLLTLTSVTVSGTAQVLDTNVFLRPSNAVRRGMPYTQLQFPYLGHTLYGLPNRIAVTGKWGRVTTLPADVWFAVLRYAQVLTLTSGNQDQDITSWSEDGFSEQLDTVGVIDPKTVLNYLPKEYERAIQVWKRVIS